MTADRPPSGEDANGRGAVDRAHGPGLDHLLDRLEALEETVDDPGEREQVRETIRLARRIPGGDFVGKRIRKYTTRDMAETFAGGILLSLPMLVEDGVFTVAEWFLVATVAGIPVFLVGNVAFVVLLRSA